MAMLTAKARRTRTMAHALYGRLVTSALMGVLGHVS